MFYIKRETAFHIYHINLESYLTVLLLVLFGLFNSDR